MNRFNFEAECSIIQGISPEVDSAIKVKVQTHISVSQIDKAGSDGQTALFLTTPLLADMNPWTEIPLPYAIPATEFSHSQLVLPCRDRDPWTRRMADTETTEKDIEENIVEDTRGHR